MAESHRVKIGGLMRCCIETVDKQETEHPGEAEEGTVMDCMHEKTGNAKLILVNGIWQYNMPDPVS